MVVKALDSFKRFLLVVGFALVDLEVKLDEVDSSLIMIFGVRVWNLNDELLFCQMMIVHSKSATAEFLLSNQKYPQRFVHCFVPERLGAMNFHHTRLLGLLVDFVLSEEFVERFTLLRGFTVLRWHTRRNLKLTIKSD